MNNVPKGARKLRESFNIFSTAVIEHAFISLFLVFEIVSLFLERAAGWVYSKKELLKKITITAYAGLVAVLLVADLKTEFVILLQWNTFSLLLKNFFLLVCMFFQFLLIVFGSSILLCRMVAASNRLDA